MCPSGINQVCPFENVKHVETSIYNCGPQGCQSQKDMRSFSSTFYEQFFEKFFVKKLNKNTSKKKATSQITWPGQKRFIYMELML